MKTGFSQGFWVLFNALAVGILFAGVLDAADWSYSGDNGPPHWKDDYPTCGGDSQSPIDIRSEDVTYRDMGKFTFEKYNTKELSMAILNNGHAAQVNINSGMALISGTGLVDNKYQLAQFHFHWGANSNQGSEHTIQGRKFPAELHLVHFNQKYNDLGEAADKPNGLAVLGIMLEVGDTDNANFATIIDALASITTPNKDNPVDIQPIQMDTLLPSNTDDFYRYQGSLTTPGCFESVQWTVFETSVKLSEAQFAEFRKLKDSHSSALVDNFRPVLDLNGRDVFTTNIDASGKASSIQISLMSTLVAIATALLAL